MVRSALLLATIFACNGCLLSRDRPMSPRDGGTDTGSRDTGSRTTCSDGWIPGVAIGSYSASQTYTWIPPYHGRFQFDTIGSTYDTVLEIRTSTALLGSDDDSGGSGTSRLTLTLSSCRELTIVVRAFSSSTTSGSHTLRITPLD